MNDTKKKEEKTLAQWLQDLSTLHQQEGDFEAPIRKDRADQFGEDWE